MRSVRVTTRETGTVRGTARRSHFSRHYLRNRSTSDIRKCFGLDRCTITSVTFSRSLEYSPPGHLYIYMSLGAKLLIDTVCQVSIPNAILYNTLSYAGLQCPLLGIRQVNIITTFNNKIKRVMKEALLEVNIGRGGGRAQSGTVSTTCH